MSNTVETVDNATIEHLRAWLSHYVTSDERRERIERHMLAFISDDPEYWCEQGWVAVFDRANCSYISADSYVA